MSSEILKGGDTIKGNLEKMTGMPISLAITDNSASVISIKAKGNSISVRMHWMFLNAPDDVIREIAGFIKTKKSHAPLVRKFINENQAFLKKKERFSGQQTIRTQGKYADIKKLFDDLNKEYFGGEIKAVISWGKGNLQRKVRKRTLGSYCGHANAIRISPVLDRRNVPRYFLQYVIYHEMLHSAIGEEKKNGRRAVHTFEFRRQERLFKEYEKAIAWEGKKIR